MKRKFQLIITIEANDEQTAEAYLDNLYINDIEILSQLINKGLNVLDIERKEIIDE